MEDVQAKRILCIEDDVDMLDLFRVLLTRHGYIVRGVTKGQEGLDVIRREKPDLVILDIMMPVMDGWQVYQQMKDDEATRNIPTIVVTAKSQLIDKVLGLEIAKVDDYIGKPFSPQELLDSITKVLKLKV
ncbi:MAG: two-component system response regulator [Chloroflexi bacterium GWB2_49_20]|nr:MAG: two-component system response regulator [Chloroflexi bacterium GWB2_49_20]OGN77146.1 MAG: two-component system response regulator [Chloroflexi bacterium GWC2_49_37]OGN83872.1 MAG: two-component system response regulator [Chloroflexi bacterium GWD2_49_16]